VSFTEDNGDGESADHLYGPVFFIEMRGLKNPATGNPCVLAAS